MKSRNVFAIVLLVMLLAGSVGVAPKRAAAQGAGLRLSVRSLASRPSGSLPAGSTAPAAGAVQVTANEYVIEDEGDDAAAPDAAARAASGRHFRGTNRLLDKNAAAQRQAAPAAALTDPKVKGVDVAGSSSKLRKSFEGVNLFQQRYVADNGNQFTVEPPDQGICAGNGYVMETVNDTLRIFKTSGEPATGVVSLNQFYGYPSAIDRHANPPTFGPALTDPSCFYDAETQRWFHVVLTIATDPATGDNGGPNYLDIAVSKTADPTGDYRFYSIEVTQDSDGSVVDDAFLGDYPQIGADDNGFYITTNTFPFFKPGFTGAYLYALSKEKLADGTISTFAAGSVPAADGAQTFTLQPAKMGAGAYVSDNNGTEYLVAAGTANSAYANFADVYALTNTESLDDSRPDLSLNIKRLATQVYGDPPPLVEQKNGPIPNGVLNFGAKEPGPIATNDSRMHQAYYTKGLLWSSLTTAVQVGGERRAGVSYFIFNVDPNLSETSVKTQGYIAVENHSLAFPAIAVTKSGKAVLTMSLTGEDYYPSTVFARLDKKGLDDGEVYVYGKGVGPQDGFTEYAPVNDAGDTRPRWGDYSAAATDGSTIWIATEYIAQRCTVSQYKEDFTCGGTRAFFGNWSTRIGAVRP